MLDSVLAPERMLTPTVAVTCVAALATCGESRVNITPTATSPAAARTLTARRMADLQRQQVSS
jgi:hypothetical protein